MTSHSRGEAAPEMCLILVPSKQEGTGKAGCRPHPWPASKKKAGGRHHRIGRTSLGFNRSSQRRLFSLMRSAGQALRLEFSNPGSFEVGH